MTSATQIMHDMEITRSEIRETLSAIEDRVSVENVVKRMVAPAKAGTIEFGKSIGSAVRDNPVALAVTAVGLGWLMWGQRRQYAGDAFAPSSRLDPQRPAEDVIRQSEVTPGSAGAGEGAAGQAAATARAAAASLKDAAQAATSWTKDKASRASSEAKATAEHVRSWTSETSRRASETVRQSASEARQSVQAARDVAGRVGTQVRENARSVGSYVREHPLLIGSVAVAAGTAAALIIARRKNAFGGADKSEVEGTYTAQQWEDPQSPKGATGYHPEEPIPGMTTDGTDRSLSPAAEEAKVCGADVSAASCDYEVAQSAVGEVPPQAMPASEPFSASAPKRPEDEAEKADQDRREPAVAGADH